MEPKEHHNEYAQRFSNESKPNYARADMKTLLTIGSDTSTVKSRVEEVNHVSGVEVVGLVVSQAHDSYQMFVRKATSAKSASAVEGPFFLFCDRVAKRFHGPDSPIFTSVQRWKKQKR